MEEVPKVSEEVDPTPQTHQPTEAHPAAEDPEKHIGRKLSDPWNEPEDDGSWGITR